MDTAKKFFGDHVVPAFDDYKEAEGRLTQEYNDGRWQADPPSPASLSAIRAASNLAVAIDGLADRVAHDTGDTRRHVLAAVDPLCIFPDGTHRAGGLERVRGVANAFKHHKLSDTTLPISSSDDVLAVGLGYGLDGFGVGKMGGPEVIVETKDGRKYKFLGDAGCAVRGWRTFLGVS